MRYTWSALAGLPWTWRCRYAFSGLAYMQLAMIVLILPGYAAGTIAMEREKRTLDTLRATLLTPSDVVTGKLLAVVGVGAVQLATSLPVALLCVALGGVAPLEAALAYALLLATALSVSSLGVCLSSIVQRSLGAIVATYVLLLLCYGLPLPIIWRATSMYGHPLALLGYAGVPYLSVGWLAAAALLAPAMGIAGALLYTAVGGWWARRRRARRLSPDSRFPRALTACVLLIFLVCFWPPAFSALAAAPGELPLLLHPCINLKAVLDDGFAQGAPDYMPGSPIHGQLYIWSLSMGALLLTAAGLWALTVHSYGARS